MTDTTTKPAPRIGAVFPQTELGGDTGAIRAWARETERAGYRHALVYDHVVGADPAVHAPWNGPYDVATTFREPFVLFGYLAALTELELVTGVIILPQRQTVLVAKQAAEVDLLTGGRFRLGVGIGWNHVEYESLGKSFRDRGRRSEEQIALLRRLWTEPSLTFEGEHERVTGAGISPLPAQRPIPVWMGGSSPRAYERIGRLADGWFPQVQPGPELDEARGIVDQAARDAGRDPASLGLEGRVSYTGDTDAVAAAIQAWTAVGATHVAVDTMGAGLSSPDAHLKVLSEIASTLGLPSRLGRLAGRLAEPALSRLSGRDVVSMPQGGYHEDMTMITAWPIVGRDRIVHAFRPGGSASAEGPFRTLRRHGWVSAGVRVALRAERGLAGQLTVFSSLNVISARLARRGDVLAAERVARTAAALESGPEFKQLGRLLAELTGSDAEQVVDGMVSGPLAEVLRAVASRTERVRADDIVLSSPAEIVFAGRIAEVTRAYVTMAQADGGTTMVPRWMADAVHRDQVGELLALMADKLDGASAVVEAVPAIEVEDIPEMGEFAPFGRGDGKALSITTDDARLLAGKPEPLRILVPVTIEG